MEFLLITRSLLLNVKFSTRYLTRIYSTLWRMVNQVPVTASSPLWNSHLFIFQLCYICPGDSTDEFMRLKAIKTAASAMAAMKGRPPVGNIQTSSTKYSLFLLRHEVDQHPLMRC